jgi:1-acyl-sn-glycerol-3-phosphate acyltransferase
LNVQQAFTHYNGWRPLYSGAFPAMETPRRSVAARPLATLRVAGRFAGGALLTLPCYLVIVGGRLALTGRPRRADAWGHRVASWWARRLGRLFGMRVEVVGRPPPAPFLLVANHLSYMDVLLLLGAAGGSFVAKREIASWPVIGHLCRLIGVVFIDRTARRDVRRVGVGVEAALAEGRGIAIFPEGTTGDGSALLPFRSSLLEVAAARRLPVYWATLRYETDDGLPDAAEAVCWTGGAALVPHALRLLSLPGFEARVAFGAEPLADDDRKRLTARLREAMAAELVRA